MVRLAQNMPHGKNQPVVSVFAAGTNDASSGAKTGHRAILHSPRIGRRYPAIERVPIEDGRHFRDVSASGCRERFRWLVRLRRGLEGYERNSEKKTEAAGFHGLAG